MSIRGPLRGHRTEEGLVLGLRVVRASRNAEEGGLRRYLEHTGVCLQEQGSRVKSTGSFLDPASEVTCMLGGRLGISFHARKTLSPCPLFDRNCPGNPWRAEGFKASAQPHRGHTQYFFGYQETNPWNGVDAHRLAWPF